MKFFRIVRNYHKMSRFATSQHLNLYPFQIIGLENGNVKPNDFIINQYCKYFELPKSLVNFLIGNNILAKLLLGFLELFEESYEH